MSIYCNCRHCVQPQLVHGEVLKGFSGPDLSAPETEDISMAELVREYKALPQKDLWMHFEAVARAVAETDEDDEDE
jgi:hypothetical protein